MKRLLVIAGLWTALLFSISPTVHAQAAFITITTTDDEVNEDGDCSLREAIQAANIDAAVDACPAGSGADVIILPTGSYRLRLGALSIDSDMHIIGAGAEQTNINGACAATQGKIGDAERVFTVQPGGYAVTFEGITIKNGIAYHGAGIYNTDGRLTVARSVFTGNMGEYGAAIFNGSFDVGAAGTLVIIDTVFVDNYYSDTLGSRVIYSSGGDVTIINSAFYSGGGIAHERSTGSLTVINSIFDDSFSYYGGAIHNDRGTVFIVHSVFTDNRSIFEGGALYNSDGVMVIADSTISANQGSTGGGIYNKRGSLTITGSTISNNLVDGYVSDKGYLIYNANGGGLYNWDGDVKIANSTISGNRALGRIAKDRVEDYCHEDCFRYADGAAAAGGAGIYSAGGTVALVNSTVYGNVVTDVVGEMAYKYEGGAGGGVVNGPSLVFNEDTRSYSENGPPGTFVLYNTIIAGNTANEARGHDCLGVFRSRDYNLIQHTGNCILEGPTGHTITGVAPLIAPLRDNGGPTWTHALVENNPAIDAGECMYTTDQRGVFRDWTCDIGAYEIGASPPDVVYAQPPALPGRDEGSHACEIEVEARLRVGYQGVFTGMETFIGHCLYDDAWHISGLYGCSGAVEMSQPFVEVGDTFDVIKGPVGMMDFYDCDCLVWWEVTLHDFDPEDYLPGASGTGWTIEWWGEYFAEPLDIPNRE
ncbi:MAG: CSLREA domain-containing protein [Anaerolineae bacterium]|nr:CSLREA domain-containing protein [Anaerolineae bacterium]